jgi:Zn finger protein HypA/HybF involved in hydrogenase expression
MGIAIIGTSTQAGLVAGAAARGEFHCTECGYGISVHRALPTCPMCHGTEWLPWVGWRHAEALDTGDVRA